MAAGYDRPGADARAERVIVLMGSGAETVRETIEYLNARGASLGLLSMEERAALAGGGLEFKSAPGEGTNVQAWFPLKWQTPAANSEGL